ncbi:MAG TPA: hypothetical protein VF407_25480 [Polyangiaceae bacterium]
MEAVVGQRRGTLLAALPPAAWGAIFALFAAVYAAFMWGFTIDDALISIRYARHLASGAGYRFDLGGPSTDGVTPLPWAFLLAPLAHAAALDVLARVKIVSVVLWIASAFALGRRVGTMPVAPAWKLVALVIGALSLPVAAGSVSGMETGVVIALATFAATEAERERLLSANILAGILAAFRPEMVVWAVVLSVTSSLVLRSPKRTAMLGAIAFAPFALCGLVRLIAFGHLAPLAVLAKPSDLAHGSVYAVAAALTALTPVLAFAPLALWRAPISAKAIALAGLAHLLAVAIAGGDWMPYARLVAPTAPSLVLAFVRSAPCAKTWSLALRSALAIALGLYFLTAAAPRGRNVGRDRAALVEASRPYLQNAHIVATADIGWPTAATEADIVDLAGLTDPEIAALPGGHTSKRVEPGMLLDRKPDVILLYATAGVTGATLDDWTSAEYEKVVDVRIASSSLISRHFEAVGFLPLGSSGAGYVVLARSEDSSAR